MLAFVDGKALLDLGFVNVPRGVAVYVEAVVTVSMMMNRPTSAERKIRARCLRRWRDSNVFEKRLWVPETRRLLLPETRVRRSNDEDTRRSGRRGIKESALVRYCLPYGSSAISSHLTHLSFMRTK